jgi:UDP-N-acetylmuramate dehydrogenase
MMEELKRFLQEHNFTDVRFNELLAKYTSFEVGGKAKVLITPDSKKQIISLVKFLYQHKIPFKVLGNGSNILISDNDYDGVIIKTNKALNYMSLDNETVVIGCGYSLVKLAYKMIDYELAGCEFFGGIPGTIGGAVFMNAGAYNREMKDIVEKVELINNHGELVTYYNDDLQYSYRNSILQTKKPLLIIEATLKLQKGEKAEINRLLDNRRLRRMQTQPLKYPSCGSTFRNPEGTNAYLLIDKAGLRGYQIGGAKVSDKHCNFIINFNNAKSNDIKNLIDYVIKIVNQTSGISLQPEVEFFNW